MDKCFKYLILAVVLLVGGAGLTGCASANAAQDEYVYICTGPKAKVYHSTPYCSGLKRCSGQVKKVSKSQTNRRACKKC